MLQLASLFVFMVGADAVAAQWTVAIFPLPKPVRAGDNILLKVEIAYGDTPLRFEPGWLSGANLLSMAIISRDMNQIAFLDTDSWRVPANGKYTAETNFTFPASGIWTATLSYLGLGQDNLQHTADPIDIAVGTNLKGRSLPALPGLKIPGQQNSSVCFIYTQQSNGQLLSIPSLSCGAAPGKAGARSTLQFKLNAAAAPVPALGVNLGTVPVGVCVGLQLTLIDNGSNKPLKTLKALVTNTERVGSKLVRFFVMHSLRKSAEQFEGIDDQLLTQIDADKNYRPAIGTKVSACQLPDSDLEESINDVLSSNSTFAFGPSLSSAFVFPKAGSYRVIALSGQQGSTTSSLILAAWFVKVV